MFRLSPLPLAAVLLCVAAGKALAQDEVDLTLLPSATLSGRSLGVTDYSDRIKVGLVNIAQDHPEVQAAVATLNGSAAETDTAKRARYPRLGVSTSSGRSQTFITQTQTVSQNFTASTASVRATLLDAGGISARIRAAEANANSLDEAVKTASQKVLLDAITGYLQAQRYDLKKRIADKSTQVLDELTRAEQRKVDLGAAGQSDARFAAARRAGAAARRQEFEALLVDALAKFEVYFKFAPNAAALPNLVVPSEWVPKEKSDALQTAETNSSEMAEARLRIERAQAVVDREKSGRFPTIDAVLQKSRDSRGLTVEPTRAALELNFNVGNGFDLQTRVRAALVDVDAQQARLEQARANVDEFTLASWGRAQSGQDRVKQLTEAVTESGAAYQSKRRLLGFGRETLVNVLDAQLEHFNQLLDLADAIFDLRIAEFRLARSLGYLKVGADGDNAWINIVVRKPGMEDIFLSNLQEPMCRGSDSACGTQPAAVAEIRNPVLRATRFMQIPGSSYGVDITAPPAN